MDERPVFYHTEIDFRNGKNDTTPGTYGGQFLLTEAQDELAKTYTYYKDLGRQIVRAQIVARCMECNGSGTRIKGVRVKKQVRCPACRGKDSEVVIETWVDLPKRLYC